MMKMKNKYLTLLILCLALGALFACKGKQDEQDGQSGTKKFNRNEAETEYEVLQAETRLANTVKPYLVFDLQRKALEIRLKGMIVWECPVEIIDNSEDLDDFARSFKGDENKLIRPLLEKHLFSFSDKTPDSILVIVGKAVDVDPELLQREIPERFQLLWDKNLVLEIRTNVVGKPISRFKNTMLELRRMIQKPFGASFLIIKMDPEMATTLYRASQPGIPTMVYPASFK
jgi:hypothetical protein